MADPYVFTAPPTPPSTNDPANFNTRADSFLGWFPTNSAEMQAFANELSTYFSQLAQAAQGGIVVTYTFDGASASVADPGNGKLRLNNLTQASATAVIADNADNIGVSATGRLALLTSTSTIKGTVYIRSALDPTKWLVGLASANTAASGYYNITIGSVLTSGSNPFTDGEDLVVTLVPKGDKGDQGDPGVSSQWTLDSTYTVTGSPTLITFTTPSGYSDLKFEFEGLTFSASADMRIAGSTDGSTFGSATALFTGLAGASGIVLITGYRGEYSGALAAIGSSAISSPNSALTGTSTSVALRHTGGMAATRFSLSTGNFGTAGTVKMFKR